MDNAFLRFNQGYVLFDRQHLLDSSGRSYLQFYAMVALRLNVLLGSNYVYVLDKPLAASVLEYFGPWP